MGEFKRWWRTLRLSLLFAAMVFVIMLLTLVLVFTGIFLLDQLGIVGSMQMKRLPLFLFALISLTVGAVLAAIFSYTSLRPLRKIMAASDRIASGDYSARIHLSGTKEFRKLSDSFNHMAEELGSVELLRNDFVNNFSHEIKTPIVSIRGFAKMLKRSGLTKEERDEYLDIIIDESERLAALSTNVLNLSKIENQAILTEKKRFNLSEQIRLVIAMLDSKWSGKQIEFCFDCDEVFANGDEELLKQVWINLLDNAIKFSADRGQVAVQVSQSAQWTSVKVIDRGCGMPEDTVGHIFDKFYQGDSSHATKGNGLGLAIAKRIVELHDGTIEVLYTGREGTAFEVRLASG